MTTYEEWRVTGTWTNEWDSVKGWQPANAKQFELTWRTDDCDAETQARNYADWALTRGVTDGPHLHKRTVTVGDWEAEA